MISKRFPIQKVELTRECGGLKRQESHPGTDCKVVLYEWEEAMKEQFIFHAMT